MKFAFTLLVCVFSFQLIQAQNEIPDTSTKYQWKNGQFILSSDVIYNGNGLCGDDYYKTLYRNYTGTTWVDSLLDTYIYTFAPDSPGVRSGKSFKVTQVMKNGAWVNKLRTTYYGYIRFPVATVQEQWIDGVWQTISQDLYIYFHGNPTLILTHTHQIARLSSWQNDYQENSIYDSLGVRMYEVTQQWDTVKNVWINSSRQLFSYISNAKQYDSPITDTVQRWINNSWQMDSLHLHNYDSTTYTIIHCVHYQQLPKSI